MAKPRDRVIREVAEHVASAIRANRRAERLIVALLVVQFLAGLALLTAGAALERWFLIVPAVCCPRCSSGRSTSSSRCGGTTFVCNCFRSYYD